MNESWLDKYNASKTWHEKCVLMALYHLTMRNQMHNCWTITDTAEYFSVSRGLVSENIKLANNIDSDSSLTKCKTRQNALDRIKLL